MKTDDLIAGMCLYGLIRREDAIEQKQCLNEIERRYGRSIAKIVRDYLKKG
jgi:hypothetical protein